jgi:hypothetical protein
MFRPVAGIRDGSTLYSASHAGHVIFIVFHGPNAASPVSACGQLNRGLLCVASYCGASRADEYQ